MGHGSWEQELVVPKHVQKLGWRKYFHKDFPGFKWYNTYTMKGRTGVTCTALALLTYGVVRMVMNSRQKAYDEKMQRRAQREARKLRERLEVVEGKGKH